MATKWCYNAKTGEIFDYQESGGLTDFPRGTYLAYGDYLVTGLQSKQEAQKWKEEWHPCLACKSVRKGEECSFCGGRLVAVAGER